MGKDRLRDLLRCRHSRRALSEPRRQLDQCGVGLVGIDPRVGRNHLAGVLEAPAHPDRDLVEPQPGVQQQRGGGPARVVEAKLRANLGLLARGPEVGAEVPRVPH